MTGEQHFREAEKLAEQARKLLGQGDLRPSGLPSPRSMPPARSPPRPEQAPVDRQQPAASSQQPAASSQQPGEHRG